MSMCNRMVMTDLRREIDVAKRWLPQVSRRYGEPISSHPGDALAVMSVREKFPEG